MTNNACTNFKVNDYSKELSFIILPHNIDESSRTNDLWIFFKNISKCPYEVKQKLETIMQLFALEFLINLEIEEEILPFKKDDFDNLLAETSIKIFPEETISFFQTFYKLNPQEQAHQLILIKEFYNALQVKAEIGIILLTKLLEILELKLNKNSIFFYSPDDIKSMVSYRLKDIRNTITHPLNDLNEHDPVKQEFKLIPKNLLVTYLAYIRIVGSLLHQNLSCIALEKLRSIKFSIVLPSINQKFFTLQDKTSKFWWKGRYFIWTNKRMKFNKKADYIKVSIPSWYCKFECQNKGEELAKIIYETFIKPKNVTVYVLGDVDYIYFILMSSIEKEFKNNQHISNLKNKYDSKANQPYTPENLQEIASDIEKYMVDNLKKQYSIIGNPEIVRIYAKGKLLKYKKYNKEHIDG